MSFAEKLLAGKLNEEKKKLIEFIKPVDESIKHKLEGMANRKTSINYNRINKRCYCRI